MPTALDRMHASIMGYMAVAAVKDGEKNKAIVYRDGKHLLMDLTEAINAEKVYNPKMYDITKILSI
jgi:6-phosphofructokinase 1